MIKKDAYYFSHDSNARHDPKTIKLRARHGLEGYGFYFCLLEIMRESADYMIDIEDLETVSYQLNIQHEKAEEIVKTCIKTGLLKQEQSKLVSESFINRMQEVDEKRKIRAESGSKGGQAKANNKQNDSKTLANDYQNCTIKGKERKEEEIKKRKGEEMDKTADKSAESTASQDLILWNYFQEQALSLRKNGEKLDADKMNDKFSHCLARIERKGYADPKAFLLKVVQEDYLMLLQE